MVSELESGTKEHGRSKNLDKGKDGSLGGVITICALLIALGVSTGKAGVIVVLSLVAMLFLHELAHYLVAKKAGMKVTEFFIGFGPKIWSFRKGETEYGLKGIPAGAYVRVIGMNNLDPVELQDEKRTYRSAKFHQRFFLASAGSIMHFLIALILLYAVLVGNGIKVDESEWNVKEVLKNGPAEQMGVEEGDRIISLNQSPVGAWSEFVSLIAGSPNEFISLEILRDGKAYSLEGQLGQLDNSTENQTQGTGFIGIARSKFPNTRVNPANAIIETGQEFGYLTKETIFGIGKFFSPAGLGDFFSDVFEINATSSEDELSSSIGNEEGRVVSVVGATRIGTQLTETGWPGLLLFLATINVFVGFFNLIPLLPLDGGHIAVAIYERMRSRKGRRYHADASKLLPLTYAVVFILIVIGVSAIYLDIADPISL